MLKLLLVVILVAVVIYLTTRALQRSGLSAPPRPRRRPEPPRVIGPDDDPDFLRDLDHKRRHPEDPDA